jgi:hypothetical protein
MLCWHSGNRFAPPHVILAKCERSFDNRQAFRKFKIFILFVARQSITDNSGKLQ